MGYVLGAQCLERAHRSSGRRRYVAVTGVCNRSHGLQRRGAADHTYDDLVGAQMARIGKGVFEMTYDKTDTKYDEALGRAAFERLQPALRDLPAEGLEHVNLDLRRVAIAALKLAAVVEQPALRARFDLLPASVFDSKHLKNLPELAWAAWHVRNELLAARARSTDVQVSAALVHDASEAKDRMMRVADYYFGDDPELGAEVASIRSGSGYLDLASDLTRLATLFDAHPEVVAADTRWYRADDVAAARRYSAAIIGALAGDDGGEWDDLSARVFTLLRRAYDEVRATGRYLFRHERRQHDFPSIFAAARPLRSRRAPTAEAPVISAAATVASDAAAPPAEDS